MTSAAIQRAKRIVPRRPVAAERRYQRMLLKAIATTHAALSEAIEGDLRRAETEEDLRKDGIFDIFRAIRALRRIINRATGNVSKREVEAAATEVRDFTVAETDRQLAIVAGVDTALLARGVVSMAPHVSTQISSGVIDGWIAKNVNLITSISTKYLDQVEEMVEVTLRKGLPTQKLRKAIQERYGVARSRAMLIARDQMGKLNGEISEQRAKDAGANEYVWSTSGDGRVRDSHRALDGLQFSWDEPPDVGHPGHDYQCRCVAVPVFNAIDAKRIREQTKRIQSAEALFNLGIKKAA